MQRLRDYSSLLRPTDLVEGFYKAIYMSNYKVIEQPKCPRCRGAVEVREHKSVTEKMLRQPFFYTRWYRCVNRECPTKNIMPKEFIVWNKNKAAGVVKTLQDDKNNKERLEFLLED
jgi:hypothetical protein